MYFPTLSTALELAATKKYGFIPITYQLPASNITPLEILRKLKKKKTPCYMFESREGNSPRARHTFLGYNPSLELWSKDGQITLKNGSNTQNFKGNPSNLIRKILSEHKSPLIPGLPPFTGGLVGYFAFEYLHYVETGLFPRAYNSTDCNDVALMFFDQVIVFDGVQNKIILVVNAKCDQLPASYGQAQAELKKLESLISSPKNHDEEEGQLISPFTPLYTKEQFMQMVCRAKESIEHGQVEQVVLANSLEADFKGNLLGAYGTLQLINPSPYMFYLNSRHLEAAGASPEALVKLEGEKIQSFSLAGTRPRGMNPDEDLRLEQELLEDGKERQEHAMLVELGLDDLRKVSTPGSVKVERHMSVERFSHVMHLGSTLTGKISPNLDALHVLEAVLPAGTVVGKPKYRAYQLVQDLEKQRRGIYGGAIGYLSFNGNLDTCIAIRFAYKQNGKVFVRTGAGIVAHSDPEREYEECMQKAGAVLEALERQKSFGGLGHEN